MSNQLIKNTALGTEKVFPKTYTEGIVDKGTGKKLAEILSNYNMYFLSYTGNTAQTRCQVPKDLRREGLWITYVDFNHKVITEWYNSDNIEDDTFGSDTYWRQGSNKLIGDISISSNGNWVINGSETKFKATGDPIKPLLRVNFSTNKLQVSYDDGNKYENLGDNPVYTLFRFNERTNTIQQSIDLGKTWTNVANDNVFYKFRTVDNKLQVSTDLGITWTDTSEYIAAWFRWASGDTVDSVGKLLISRDLSTWEDLSPNMVNNLRIKGYVSTVGLLPTSTAALGDIYMVGPTYDTSDTTHDYPHYRMWVKQSSGWVDNGEYLSNVLISLTTGLETGITMSLKAITDNLSVYNVDVSNPLSEGFYTAATARRAVPVKIRKSNLIITYKTDIATSVIELYTGISVDNWNKNSYWSLLPSIDTARRAYYAIFGESSSKKLGIVFNNIYKNSPVNITVKNNTQETKNFKIGTSSAIDSSVIESYIIAMWPGSNILTQEIILNGGEQFTLKNYIFSDKVAKCFLTGNIIDGDITLTLEGLNSIIPVVKKNSENITNLLKDTSVIFDKVNYILEENLGIKDSLMVGGNFGTANNFTIPDTYIVPVNDFYFNVNGIHKMFTRSYTNNQFQSAIFISNAKDLWQAIINAPDKFTRLELLCYCKEKEAQGRILVRAYNNLGQNQVYLLKEKKSDTVFKATLVIDNSLMVADNITYLYLNVSVNNLTTYTELGDFGVSGYKMAIFDTLEEAKSIKIKGDWLNNATITEQYVQNELALDKYGQFGTVYNNVKRNQDLLGFAISLIKKYENTGLAYLYNRVLVSFNGDSIIGSQLGDITKSDGYDTGEFPPNMSKNIMARMFFNKYRFSNEDVIFRNLIHSDWIKTGFTVNNGKDDSSLTFNEVEVYGCEEGDSAEITITGKKYIKFIWSEYKGKAYSFNIMMSVNGGAETKLETVNVTADRRLMTAYIIKNLDSNNTYKFRIVPTSGFSDVCFWGIEAWSNLRLDVVVEAFSGSTINSNQNKLLDGWYSSFHTPALVISDMLVTNDASSVWLNNWMNYTGALFSYLNQNGVPALFFIPHNVTHKFLVKNGGKFANLYNVAIVDIQSKMKYNAPASKIVNNTDGLHLSNYGNAYYFEELERIFDNYEV